MADWIALFRAAKHPRLVDPVDNRDITDKALMGLRGGRRRSG